MAESQSTRDTKAWLAAANANQYVPSKDFGSPDSGTEQGNPSDQNVGGAGRNVSSDGSLDSKS